MIDDRTDTLFSDAGGAEGVLSVDTTRHDRLGAIVKAVGAVDTQTAAALWAVLDAHLASGRRFLRLDLSGVTRLDPAALVGIVARHEKVLTRRGTLVITGVRSVVAQALRTAGLTNRLFISGARGDNDLAPAAGEPAADFAEFSAEFASN